MLIPERFRGNHLGHMNRFFVDPVTRPIIPCSLRCGLKLTSIGSSLPSLRRPNSSRLEPIAEIPIVREVLPQIIGAEEQTLQAWVRDAQRLGARQVTSKFLCGAAWNEIVNFARRDPTIDLIVMGTHGRTGLHHMLIGSVAEKVVRHAPCRVLVTREREEQPVCA
jgi:nucleotide-binding universal stress UspA family protein